LSFFIFDPIDQVVDGRPCIIEDAIVRCFQIIQGVRSAREASPFLIAAEVFVLARGHQSTRKARSRAGHMSCASRQHLMPDVPGEWAVDDEVVH
jgi:hypothetical protein